MSLSLETLPLFLLAGAAAGFVNTVAGGGSFFSFPLLIFLGFSPQVANGTIRVTILLQNLVAVPTYARQGYFRPRAALALAAAAIPAAVAGAFVAVRLDPERFRAVAAGLLVVVLVTLFVKAGAWTREEQRASIRWGLALPLMAAVGFYGGFFQLGAGMPFLAVAVLAGGWDLVTANSMKVLVIFLYTAVALLVFASAEQVAWGPGVALGAGNMAGAWIGARSAAKGGPGWIRWVLVTMGLLAAGKMLLGGV